MSDVIVLAIVQQMLQTTFLVGGPLLGVALGLGLVISLVQAVTQIQEATLAFVPKLIGVAAVLVFLGPWMIRVLVGFTQGLLVSLPRFVQ